MPKVRFSAPARNFLRLGSVHLQAETEPDDVRIANCCVTLNPLGAIACDILGFPSIINVDWGSTGVEVRAQESREILTIVGPLVAGPGGTQTGTYSINPPPTMQGQRQIQTVGNCSWQEELIDVVPAQMGSSEQLTSGDAFDPFNQVYSPPHQAPLVQTGAATSRTMKFVLNVVDQGGGFYTLEGLLTHSGTASYDGFFTVNDARFAADGGNFITTIDAAPAAQRPWHDWWRDSNVSGWTYVQPNVDQNNGANGRRQEVNNKAGTIRYQPTPNIPRTLADWAVIVASGSVTMELNPFSSPVDRWGFITNVPATINLSW